MTETAMTHGLGLNRWLVRPKPNRSARLRLFCLPFAGAGASLFANWPRLLPTTVDVCAIQLPGRNQRVFDAPYAELDPLLDQLLDATSHERTLPFAFFGHSMGALIAFEWARRLRRLGLPGPVHLF